MTGLTTEVTYGDGPAAGKGVTGGAHSAFPGPPAARSVGALWWLRCALLLSVAAVFPVGALAVFKFGADRLVVADLIAVVYSVGLFAAFTTALWPLRGLRNWSRQDRIGSCVLLFLGVSYATHLSWELGWLLLHPWIAESRELAWAYPWWAYIDGGDARYADPTPTLLMMEMLSVTNGLIGAIGWWRWRRRPGDALALRLFAATAIVHLYSTSLYFGGELIDGLSSVNTARWLDLWIKFGLANAPWLVFPCLVLWWSTRMRRRA